MKTHHLLKILALAFIGTIFFLFFYFKLYQHLNFMSFRQHQEQLLHWRNHHYLLSVLAYIGFYTLAILVSFPGCVFLTLLGGYLFGLFPGLLYVHLSITLGSTLIFLILRFALAEWITQKLGPRLAKWEEGFRENAFSYLLTLRLIPLIPFWITNILASLLDLRISTFISATALGIIPAVIIYTSVGQNLGRLLQGEDNPSFTLILQPHFLLPLLGLAVLALSPVIYKKFLKK